MILILTIMIINRTNREHTRKDLILDTVTLEPSVRAAVELITEDPAIELKPKILKYRHLFTAELSSSTQYVEGRVVFVGPSDYWEDEKGQRVSRNEVIQIKTGNPQLVSIPHSYEDHDLELILSESKPLPLAQGKISDEDVRLLGIFDRDIQELQESKFITNNPGTLQTVGFPTLSSSQPMQLETPCNDDELRSFIMIFRRLYMTSNNDPANLYLIVKLVTKAFGDHPYGTWIEKSFKSYKDHLDRKQKIGLFGPSFECTFTTKKLIDVFLYYHYAHQPDVKKERDFNAYIQELSGNRDLLTWLFLTEIHRLGCKMRSISSAIRPWFRKYCEQNNCWPQSAISIHKSISGIGAQEKQEDRSKRLFDEKVKQLACDLWIDSSEPAGGHELFLETARKQLKELLEN